MTRAAVLAAVWLAVGPLAAAGEQPLQWRAPTLVTETAGDLYEPVLAADQASRLQLAWALHGHAEGPVQQIVLASWDGSSWTTPVAVNTGQGANAPDLVGDPFAELHLIWSSTDARLDYSWTRADVSTDPASWAGHVAIAHSNIRAQLRADGAGRLHLLYPAHDAGGTMYRASDDGGIWWSEAVRVAAPAIADAAADFTRLAIAADGTLHAVWTEFAFPQAWPPRGVFHARSTDGGRSWTAAEALAGEGYDQINVVAVDPQTIHVAWNGMAGVWGRYQRISHDGGATWSPVQTVVPSGGSEGPPQLVVDAAHTLHLVTTYNTAAWHMTWDGQRWSTPTCLSCGLEPKPTLVEEPTAAIRNGNELHVVFWDARHRLWHTWAALDAPLVAPLPVRDAEWSSPRFWYRQQGRVPLLIALAVGMALTRTVRTVRGRRARRHASARPEAAEGTADEPALGGRIAFFPSAEYLAANPYWPRLRQALEALGVEVLPATPLTFGRRWLAEHRRDVRVLHLHFVQPFYAYEAVRARLRWVLRFARSLLLARAYGYRTVFTLHDLRPPHPLRPAWVDYLGHWTAANLSDRVIVHCAAAAVALRTRYGRRGGVHVIEHPGYVGVYPGNPDRQVARARFGWTTGERVFLFFGGLRPGKGVEALLDAFVALDAAPARLLIAGRPELPDDAIERLQARAARDSRLRLELRYIPDAEVGAFFAAADVVVLPFSEVLTSASAILALSFARPVIAPARGCLPELLADDAGLLYDPTDPQALREALRRCLDEDLAALGRVGFERVRGRTWELAARQTLAVYRAALHL